MGWKYGKSGKCYTGASAKTRAALQGRAVEHAKAERKKGKGGK